MKKIVNLLLVIFSMSLFFSCSGKKEHTAKFSFEPENPVAGENITIYFNSDSTKLANENAVKMFAYFFNDKLDTTVEKDMKKDLNIWKANIKTPVESRGVIIKFTDGDEKEENNSQKGYFILFSDKSGKISPEAEADLGIAYTGWGRVGGMARDFEKALNAFDSAFKSKPELKNKYLDNYFEAMWKKNKVAAKKMIKSELEKIRVKKNKNEDDYLLLWTWYGNIGENAKSEKYKNEAIKNFPNGKVAEQYLISKFRMEREPKKKETLLEEIAGKFPNVENLDDLYDGAAYSVAKTGDAKQIIMFFKQNVNHIHPYYFVFAGDQLLQNGDKATAEMLYSLGGEHAMKMLADLSKTLPKDMSLSEYQAQIKYYLGKNQYGLAKIFLKENNNQKALNLLSKAVINTTNYNVLPDLLQAYIHALVNEDSFKEALTRGEQFIKEGNATSGMIKDLRTAFIGVYKSDKGFEKYINKNKSLAKQMLIEKIKGEMVNEHAPDFTLKDLEGKDVSLSSLKGKIVVLDFWATWCGPCLRSFPAMNKLATEFKNSKDVVFLFINTWENVKDKVQNVKDFSKKNNYNLEFLIDSENKVVTEYKVTGIPTKVFIGKDGNIKMRSIGFSGNTDQLVEEVKTIIDVMQKTN